ncbi:ATP-binding protein [Streptomyces hainanensis]|uniref:ATP-binding protein n=1 Tax=Streptomyces hainanensis TaxID=402648 RepID=A0A4R4TFM5_9ACTN|nr:ATP-binding protein [Streptomyces hainanensis]TDC76468.1 ATP-binding protein [Streptomyces hainanensis]
MKQSTVKTLGAAALGAAIAASAAGAATAANLENLQSAAGDVVRTLPADSATDVLPDGAGNVVETGTQLLDNGSEALPLASDTLSHTSSSDDTLDSVQGLLGGMPLGDPNSVDLGDAGDVLGPAGDLLGSAHLL